MAIWVREQDTPEELEMVEGSTITYSVTFEGATSVSTVSAEVFVNGNPSDQAATIFPSGSTSASGNVATLKPFVATAAVGGKKCTVAVTATVDGNTERVKFEIFVVKENATR